MGVFNIVVEPNVRRRRERRSSAEKRKAASLFRIWHGVRELLDEAEKLGDGELVHFLSVAQMLVEEKVSTMSSGVPAFETVDTSLPN
jgi:hypothetical protein